MSKQIDLEFPPESSAEQGSLHASSWSALWACCSEQQSCLRLGALQALRTLSVLIPICRETPFLFPKTYRSCVLEPLAPCICIPHGVAEPCLSLYLRDRAADTIVLLHPPLDPTPYPTLSSPKLPFLRPKYAPTFG